MSKEPEAVQELRDNIVAAAAEAIVATMTPQMMRKCAEGLLENVISKISSDEYGSLGRLVKDKAEAAMREYMDTDRAKSQLHSAVVQGVNEAMSGLSEQVKGKVIDVSLGAMSKALEGKSHR